MIAAPGVDRAIESDQAVIEGLERDEANNLARNLNAGALPVRLTVIQTSIVEATLGEQTLVKAVQAGLIGVLAVMAFMIIYYRVPGVLASMALFTYIVTTMMLFKLGPIIGPVTITLAGIAGFVLSIGMAVDANILVFERMKEELRSGRSLASAVEHGFDRAWSSIRDSNISTLITCGILWWFGEQFNAQLVQGFAVTLAIGVLVSMFTAITATRTLLRLTVGTPLAKRLWLFAPDLGAAASSGSVTEAAAPKKRFALDFVDRRWFYFGLSAVLLVPGILSMLIPPAFNPGIEFTSGATFTIDFEEPVSKQQVEDALAEIGHDEARVQRTSDDNYIIRLDELEGASGPPIGATPPSDRDTLEEQLEAELGPFRVTNFNAVSEIVSQEIVKQAIVAVLFAAAAILVYITYSFRNIPNAYRYGIAAVIAALHDAVFVLGAISILGKVFGTEVDSMVITGLLTVIGFSVHDTIVVFDRIREKVSPVPGRAVRRGGERQPDGDCWTLDQHVVHGAFDDRLDAAVRPELDQRTADHAVPGDHRGHVQLDLHREPDRGGVGRRGLQPHLAEDPAGPGRDARAGADHLAVTHKTRNPVGAPIRRGPYCFLRTCASPERRVTCVASRCSRIAWAYLRLVPNMSRTSRK